MLKHTGPGTPGDEAPDAELVARAQADRQAFAPLYARYLEPVYRYCYRRLGSREAAEDATSQIFCQALGALPSCRGSFRAWLFAIAHNVVADWGRRGRTAQPLEAVADPVDGDPSPEVLVLAAEERASVRRLLAGLPSDQRRVIELRLAGLTSAEIAAVLGRSLASIKMLQFRAIARLRDRLAIGAAATEGHDDTH